MNNPPMTKESMKAFFEQINNQPLYGSLSNVTNPCNEIPLTTVKPHNAGLLAMAEASGHLVTIDGDRWLGRRKDKIWHAELVRPEQNVWTKSFEIRELDLWPMTVEEMVQASMNREKDEALWQWARKLFHLDVADQILEGFREPELVIRSIPMPPPMIEMAATWRIYPPPPPPMLIGVDWFRPKGERLNKNNDDFSRVRSAHSMGTAVDLAIRS
jgi:hypothetical protein